MNERGASFALGSGGLFDTLMSSDIETDRGAVCMRYASVWGKKIRALCAHIADGRLTHKSGAGVELFNINFGPNSCASVG